MPLNFEIRFSPSCRQSQIQALDKFTSQWGACGGEGEKVVKRKQEEEDSTRKTTKTRNEDGVRKV
jgi:hypothetical protein